MKNTLFAIGESLIDFIPSESGVAFDEIEAFYPKVGGAPANVLGAFAKLGGKTQMLTQLGDDPFGHKILNALKNWNIGTDYIKLTDEANTALAFVSLLPDGNREFSFYRNPSADMLYGCEQIEEAWFDDCYGLHFCSVSLGDTPMKKTHRKAIDLVLQKGGIVSFDLNLRFPLWKDKNELKKAVLEFMPYAHVVKLSDEELEFTTGMTDINEAKEQLLKGNTELVLYTCGKDGAYAITKNHTVFSPAHNVRAVDTTGAGDAFCGSFLYSLSKDGIDRTSLGEIDEKLWKRTDYTWPCTWFAPRTTGEGAFKTAYDVMNNWGANHGAISYGHIGADVITLCSMLRIPVCMHNVPEEDIYRPSSWNAFGMDKEGQDYRACQAYGPMYKNIRY